MKSPGVLLSLALLILVLYNTLVYCKRPDVVNVGAIFSYDTVIGRAAKVAMEMAVDDVNKDPTILNGTQFKLIMEDSNCSVFLGSMKAFQVIDREVVAVLGPQSSAVAHMISQIATALQVPLISFSATDPTLSSLQFPYFLRTTQSDLYQMVAMADLIQSYRWKEVIAIYVDDDYGRNCITVLGDELQKRKAKIHYKLALSSQYDLNDIADVLNSSKPLGPRVYVVHLNPDPTFRIFNIAEKLHMMTKDYVWLATDWLCTTLGSLSPKNRVPLKMLQGVVGLRQYTPEKTMEKAFQSRWIKVQDDGSISSELNFYGLYAYDTVWAVAHSLNKFLDEGNNITFAVSDKLKNVKESEIQLGKLKTFESGDNLRKILLETNFTGLTGKVEFNSDRNLVPCSYEIINIVQMDIRTVGYWSNTTGVSILPPEFVKPENTSFSSWDQKLGNVTWPGGKKERPRGWVIGDDERPLKIGVPKRASFVDFVTELENHTVQGYCIDVFREVLKLVPYGLPYNFVPYGDGLVNPHYDDIVKLVKSEDFDAAVGDIAIVTNRTKIVDFTQPYISTGLVIVAPIRNSDSSAWVFLKPFTWEMWAVTAASFVIIAVVIWILEHRVNDDFRGPPKRQIITMFLFSMSTLFKTNQEDTVSPLGKMVMVVWLFLLMVITSSYTASLTSILTVQQLPSSITGIESLIASNLPIGYQVGSFAYNYMTDSLSISPSRLIRLDTPEDYERSLRQGPKNGGVAAIVDELPYVELFLTNQTDFRIVGQSFTKSGWGFVFQKDSPLAIDLSTAILKLAEGGGLQKLHDKWFCKKGCAASRLQNAEPNQLNFSSFVGLYIVFGAVTLLAFTIFLLRTIRQYIRYIKKQMDPSCPPSAKTSFYKGLNNFLDFIDEKEEAIKRRFRGDQTPPLTRSRSEG